MRTWILPCFFVGLALSSGCSPEGAADVSADRVLPSVEAVTARHGSLPLTQRLSGAVRARNQVGIYPRISAVVTEVLVENGDAVEPGQPLVRLRDAEFDDRLEQARANLQITRAQLRRARAQAREARSALERTRSLREKGLTTDATVETAEAEAESAEAEVELAEARVDQAAASVREQEENLTRTVIRAPIAGVAGDRDAEVGMLASPSDRLFTLGQLDSIRVDVVLTDRMLAYIEEGQRAEVNAGGTILSAPVARISPFLNPVAHTTEAEIDLANPDREFRPGMFVSVDVFYGESEEATLVPLSAIYEDPATGAVGIFATEASLDPPPQSDEVPRTTPLSDPVTFRFVPVELVARGRLEAAVRGIEPGTWVVTLGQNLLGGDAPSARVRPVSWERAERLQTLQREDLMREVVRNRSSR